MSLVCAISNLTDGNRFELYERNHGRGKSDKEYSIRLSLSEGAHSSNVLDSALDARHSLNVQPRRRVDVFKFGLSINRAESSLPFLQEIDATPSI